MVSNLSKNVQDSTSDTVPTVLVVDDDPAMLALLSRVLGRRYTVREFDSPNAALTHLREEPVDIIVTDYMLPQMNGIEFLKATQTIVPDAQCMILTGHSDLETTVAAINEGAIDFFLAKPVRAEDLYQAVEKLWKNRRLQLERDRFAAENQAMIEELKRFNAKLEETVNERTQELTRTNVMLKQALHEIEAKNQTLTELNQSLNVLATEDPLTGLYNRREFHARLGNEWERFRRYNRPFSLIMLDIDHFKKINDTHGHDCGDVVLAKLGELLRYQKRRQDVVCRYGGEEFVVVLAETKLAAAVKVAEKLRKQVEQARFKCGATEIPVRVSLGVSGVDIHRPETEADLVRIADMGLYMAKHSGRNRTIVIDPADPEKALNVDDA